MAIAPTNKKKMAIHFSKKREKRKLSPFPSKQSNLQKQVDKNAKERRLRHKTYRAVDRPVTPTILVSANLAQLDYQSYANGTTTLEKFHRFDCEER